MYFSLFTFWEGTQKKLRGGEIMKNGNYIHPCTLQSYLYIQGFRIRIRLQKRL